MTFPFQRIAVVIRGHLRTWNYTKKHIQQFFAGISQQVDYYVIFWDYEQTRKHNIIQDFPENNLVKYLLVPIPQDNGHWTEGLYNGWAGPAYLAKHAYPEIGEQEYDVIFETRPDVIPVRNYSVYPVAPTYHQYFTSEIPIIRLNPAEEYNKNHVGLDDWMYIVHPKRYSQIVERKNVIAGDPELMNTWSTYGHQRALPKYIQKCGMKIWRAQWMKTFFARPNCIPYLEESDFTDGWQRHISTAPEPKCTKLHGLSLDWGTKLSNQQKMEFIDKYNLGKEEWGNSFHWNSNENY